MEDAADITQILLEIEAGEQAASERLLPLVYQELRALAARKLASEKPGQTLQATALVHEAYLRLVDVDHPQLWDSRGHFFAAAAEAMRRILVENARRKRSLKGGGNMVQHALLDSQLPEGGTDDELLALDEALELLAKVDAQAAELVKLRYFSGLTIPQAAEALGMAPRSADRLWAYAKAWLFEALRGLD